MPIRVVLADDHGIVRQGLRALLEQTEEMDIQVVGEAENGRIAVQMCREAQPDIVVMDVMMPELNGMEATRQIVRDNPKVKVISVSVHTRKDIVSNMLRAGASGYIVKDDIFDELLLALKHVSAGQTYLSPVVREVVMGGAGDTSSPKTSPLTSREREILQMLSEGKSNKEIAAVINRSVKTVEMHRQNTMNKLNLHTIAGLTKYAIREGMTTLHA